MARFAGIIKCMHCGKNYRGKKERGKQVYICSGYHNYGATHCPRNILREDYLIDLVRNHIEIERQRDRVEVRRREKDYPDENDYAKAIEAKPGHLIITYIDGTHTLIKEARQTY
jgi:hypothetical protein